MPYQTNIEEPIPDFRAALESMKTVEIDQELVKQLRDNIILIEDLTPEQAREQRINLCLAWHPAIAG